MTDFYNCVHSTVGKLALDIAGSMGLPSFEIDDVTAVSEALSSDDPAVLWQVISVAESPRDPLWGLSFLIGAKTNSDVGNAVLTGVVSEVTDRLSIHQEVPIANYTSAGSDQEGSMHIVSSVVDPQEFERTAGVRMVSLSAKVSRKL